MTPYRHPKYTVPTWIKRATETLRPKPFLKTSQWAEENIMLSGGAINGPWRNSVTPYLVEIMDSINDPQIEKVVFCKSTQVGGTSALLNMLASLAAQDPAPTMVVYPTDNLAKSVSEARLQPMFKGCKGTRDKFRENDSSVLELVFDDMRVYLNGANSPSSLASKPIRYLFLDEVDKFPGATKKEADPISLAVERTKTFNTNRFIFMTSTPTIRTGPIWRELEAADGEKHYFVPCPHCGEYIELKFAQIKWPDKENVPDRNERADCATYVCQACGCIITDRDKGEMLRKGRWQFIRKSGGTVKSVAYWINTLYSPFTTFPDIAREFLLSKDDPDRLHNFINSWLGEIFEDTKLKTSADLVMERQTELGPYVLPDWTKLLVAGIDVQQQSVYYTIRAFGVHLISQNVAHGQVLSMREIEQIMNMEFRKQDGTPMVVDLALMDSGDQTDLVYDFCVRNSDWCLPCKGVPASNNHYRLSTVNKAGSKAYGMTLVLVCGDKYKDMIASRLQKPNDTAGSWMVHKDIDREYCEQISSEQKITERAANGRETTRWVPKTSHAANHWLDCECYAFAAADILGVRMLFMENQTDEEGKPVQKPQKRNQEPAEESWIRENDGWL